MGALDPNLDRLRQELLDAIQASEARTMQRFDAVDARFDGVDARFACVDARFASVDARFASVDTRFESVDARLASVDARIESVDARVTSVDAHLASVDAGLASLDARFPSVDARFEAILEHINASASETRRHFDVVAESLRSDIRLLAEGLVALDQKTDRLQNELREEFARVDRRFLHLEARVSSALEGR